MDRLIIQYSTSTVWQSEVIRRLCHSPFSHVDIVLPEGLLGASGPDPHSRALVKGMIVPDPGGVQIRPNPPWAYLSPAKQVVIRTPHAERVIELAKQQIGKPFDNGALYNFLSSDPGDRNWREQDKWFCSELVIWACEVAGVFPWSLAALKNRISPADSLLILNPLMETDSIEGLLT